MLAAATAINAANLVVSDQAIMLVRNIALIYLGYLSLGQLSNVEETE